MSVFTGIVRALGRVVALERRGRGARLTVDARALGRALGRGESLAVDGVCLTALGSAPRPARGRFVADLTGETLRRTTLGERAPGDRVHLEAPLAGGEPFGGHFVLGHVDARGRVEALERARDGAWLVVRYPRRYDPLVVEKGSIAVDGVSLTVADARPGRAGIALVPHTLRATHLGDGGAGRIVNLEFDYLGKLIVHGLEARERRRASAARRRHGGRKA